MEKKSFSLDLDRCVGCYTCVVACMDQNDTVVRDDDFMWRFVASVPGERKIQYFSIACLHCDDAPCVVSCPTGALSKNEELGFVMPDRTKCIGCHSCAMNCPYGAPKYDCDGKIEKCTGCDIRVKNGLLPACVRACPTRALKYE